jgi:hypothetical protein
MTAVAMETTQKDKSDFDKLKTIEEILDDVPILDARDFCISRDD